MISAEEVVKEVRKDKYNEFFLGEVMANDDPEQKFRLKVKIYPWFAGVKTNDQLPWIDPLNVNKEKMERLPEVGKWVWCIFKGDPMSPFWVFKKTGVLALTAELNAKILGKASALSYPNYEILSYKDDVLVLVNDDAGEVVVLSGTSVMTVKEGTINIEGGQINITGSVGVRLNNGVMGANDFPNCLFSGAPHCLDPTQRVKVP